jgi:TDG/mug DNA glycosylase family protein
MGKLIKSLDPIIEKNSRVLILGTMPGPKSLSKGEYYASPRNQFWKIIYRVLNVTEEPPLDYKERKQFLKKKGIALWDVLESCEREGANDSKIKNGKPNDFKTWLRKRRNLRRIFFNGKKAEHYFKKYGCPEHVERIGLPSTSSANTRMTVDEKVGRWRIIKDSL